MTLGHCTNGRFFQYGNESKSSTLKLPHLLEVILTVNRSPRITNGGMTIYTVAQITKSRHLGVTLFKKHSPVSYLCDIQLTNTSLLVRSTCHGARTKTASARFATWEFSQIPLTAL